MVFFTHTCTCMCARLVILNKNPRLIGTFFLGRQCGIVVRAWASCDRKVSGQLFWLCSQHAVSWKESVCVSVDFISLYEHVHVNNLDIVQSTVCTCSGKHIYTINLNSRAHIYIKIGITFYHAYWLVRQAKHPCPTPNLSLTLTFCLPLSQVHKLVQQLSVH